MVATCLAITCAYNGVWASQRKAPSTPIMSSVFMPKKMVAARAMLRAVSRAVWSNAGVPCSGLVCCDHAEARPKMLMPTADYALTGEHGPMKVPPPPNAVLRETTLFCR